MSKPACPCVLKAILGVILGILLFSVAAYFVNQYFKTATGNTPPGTEALLAAPKTLTAFQLTAHDQQPLDIARLKGKWTLLFFGYTHCPDVCPVTLTELTQGLQQLEPAVLNDTQVVFVSVDPRRDTPASLGNYVHYFDERYIGATGSIEELAVLVRQLDSKFSLGTNPAGEPIVNHSSAILLLDPQVRYYARLKAPHYSENIRAQYLALRDSYLETTPRDKQ